MKKLTGLGGLKGFQILNYENERKYSDKKDTDGK